MCLCGIVSQELDCDKLEASQRSHNLMHLDRSVQTMARGLSLLRGHSGVVNEGAPSSGSSGSKTSKTAADVSSNRGHGRFQTADEKKKFAAQSAPVANEESSASVGTGEDRKVHNEEENVEERVEVAEEEVLDDDDDDDDFDLT
mmetsp:Transcript_23308/g.39494  ORF Transcript_23308/g.39494 Transcript_23308/m.39494 type:complete len:144 (-) Transcript_23308:213-644(-)